MILLKKNSITNFKFKGEKLNYKFRIERKIFIKMNLTINALSLCLLTSPALTFLHQNLNLKNLHIFYSFDHFIYGNNMKIQKSLIMQSTFNHFLSAPVSIFQNSEYFTDDKTIISNEFITGSLQYSQCCDYEFISNTFSNCISRGDHSHGGAIFIHCNNQASKIQVNVKITNNCFLSCESDQGGSFYIDCESATIQENTFKMCEAIYFSILYLGVSKEATLSQSHFVFSKKEESSRGNAISVVSKSDINEKNLNISSNKLNSGHAIFHASSPLVGNTVRYNYLSFFNNTSKNVLSISSAHISIIENSNFVKNQGFDSLIDLKIQIRCQSCAFISDNSKLLTTKYTIFASCVFDDEEDQIRFTLHSLSNCKFNTEKTFDVKINPEQTCMTVKPNSQGSNKNTKIFLSSFLPVFFCLIVAGVIFVILYGIKHNWFRRKTDTVPLMYV